MIDRVRSIDSHGCTNIDRAPILIELDRADQSNLRIRQCMIDRISEIDQARSIDFDGFAGSHPDAECNLDGI